MLTPLAKPSTIAKTVPQQMGVLGEVGWHLDHKAVYKDQEDEEQIVAGLPAPELVHCAEQLLYACGSCEPQPAKHLHPGAAGMS